MTDRSGGYSTGRARRAQILDAAVAAFGRSGFHTATLTDIARACGISRQGILHHFGSKEGLLTAVLERRDAADRRAFEAALAKSVSPFQAMTDIIARNAQAPGLTALYSMLSAEAINPEHPAHDYFVGLYARLRADVAESIRGAQARGFVDASFEPDTLAQQVLALRDGLALQSLLEPGVVDDVGTLASGMERLTGAPVVARRL